MTGLLVTKRGLRGAALGVVALVLALACGRAVDQPEAGSNSNWLKKCVVTAECGADLACLCGVCTKGCASSAECAASECLALPNECVDAVAVGRACAVPCQGAGECVSLLGDSAQCSEGFCVALASGVQGVDAGGVPGPVVSQPPVNSDVGAQSADSNEGMICFDQLCLSSILVELRTPGDTWAAGEYVLTLTSGDFTRTCDFAFGPATDAGASVELERQLTCAPALVQDGNELPEWVFVSGLTPVEPCEDPCEQTYARSYLLAVVNPGPGSPTDLRLALTRDGASLLDTTRSIEISETEPNGPGCGICRRGELRLTFEE